MIEPVAPPIWVKGITDVGVRAKPELRAAAIAKLEKLAARRRISAWEICRTPRIAHAILHTYGWEFNGYDWQRIRH